MWPIDSHCVVFEVEHALMGYLSTLLLNVLILLATKHDISIIIEEVMVIIGNTIYV